MVQQVFEKGTVLVYVLCLSLSLYLCMYMYIDIYTNDTNYWVNSYFVHLPFISNLILSSMQWGSKLVTVDKTPDS